MSWLIDLTGQRFGRWTVLKKMPKQEYKTTSSAWWLCRCDCGKEAIVSSASLRKGTSKSCGCYRTELIRERARKEKEWKYYAYQA